MGWSLLALVIVNPLWPFGPSFCGWGRLVVGLWGHWVNTDLTIRETARPSPQAIVQSCVESGWWWCLLGTCSPLRLHWWLLFKSLASNECWVSFCGFDVHFPSVHGAGYLFTCLSAICVYFSVKPFAHFKNWCLCILGTLVSVKCIYWKCFLLNFLQFFSPNVFSKFSYLILCTFDNI